MSRASEYSDAVAEDICAEVADGGTLRDICERRDMPARSTVYAWLSVHPDFAASYARAVDLRTELLADELLEIADDTTGDTIITDSGIRADNEWINRSRLRVDTRKWLLAKLMPKKYGEKVELDHTGTIRHEDAIKELA